MPILSVFMGSSSTSFLLYKGEKDFVLYNYPYSYNPNFNRTSRKQFYLDLFDFVTGELGLNHTECDVLLTDLVDPSLGDYQIKSSKLLRDVLLSVTDFSCIFVDSYSLLIGGECLSASPYSGTNSFIRLNEVEQHNYIANSTMYLNSNPQKDFDIFDKDDITRYLADNLEVKSPSSNKILFTGDRFANINDFKSLAYLLAFDLIKSPGFYTLYLDTGNFLPCAAHIAMYKPEASHLIQDVSTFMLGNLVNAPDGVECLIKSNVGTSQLVVIRNEGIQLYPFEKDTSTTVVIKNATLGSSEKSLKGGELGIILDTRKKQLTKLIPEAETRHKQYRDWQHSIEMTSGKL